jgi:hypothetical protein
MSKTKFKGFEALNPFFALIKEALDPLTLALIYAEI